MIQYKTAILPNGLKVLVHTDKKSPLSVVNVLYDVGSRDEIPSSTGFAHLFEHLMFGGSNGAPDFDQVMQKAGGENNAFTNSDMTNFYNVLPDVNLESALFLEADRMTNLILDQKALDIQKRVVVEEFHETCLNTPYGEAWHHILGLSYDQHPYRWPTIGLTPEHIENANLNEVSAFYNTYYHPKNAILSICSCREEDEVIDLCLKYFGGIVKDHPIARNYTEEPIQKSPRRKAVKDSVPSDSVFLTFHMAPRNSSAYYATDLLSDLMANGNSSRLRSKLIKEDESFINIDAYVSGSLDPGLFIVEGQPAQGVSLEKAEEIIWDELDSIVHSGFSETELQKQKNKVRTNLIMSETSNITKAMSLGFYQLLGDPDLINDEEERYEQVFMDDIQKVSAEIIKRDNSSTLTYKAKDQSQNPQ